MSDVEKTPSDNLELFPDTHLPPIDLEALAEIPRSSFMGWGATPLATFGVPGLVRMQQRVHNLLLNGRILNVSPETDTIPSEIRDYVAFNFTSRFWGRIHANSDNYEWRLQKDLSCLDEQETEILKRAQRGAANPAELLYVQSRLLIPSSELGCITHPYGTHTDKLEEMREAVRAAMELFGATMCPEAELQNIFAIKQTDQVTNVVGRQQREDGDDYGRMILGEQPNMHLKDAVVITRKRDHGVLPDGKIVRERTSFVFRPRLLDQRLAKMMQEVDLVYNPHALDQLNEIARDMELDGVFADLIREKMFDIITPLSTTIYAFDRETIAEIKQRKKQRGIARAAWNADLRRQIEETEEELPPDAARTIANSINLDASDSDF